MYVSILYLLIHKPGQDQPRALDVFFITPDNNIIVFLGGDGKMILLSNKVDIA